MPSHWCLTLKCRNICQACTVTKAHGYGVLWAMGLCRTVQEKADRPNRINTTGIQSSGGATTQKWLGQKKTIRLDHGHHMKWKAFTLCSSWSSCHHRAAKPSNDDWNLWSCEPRKTFLPSNAIPQVFRHSVGKLIDIPRQPQRVIWFGLRTFTAVQQFTVCILASSSIPCSLGKGCQRVSGYYLASHLGTGPKRAGSDTSSMSLAMCWLLCLSLGYASNLPGHQEIT